MTNATQIKRKFKSSMRRGTGEAVLLMRQYPDVDFSAEIIAASLKNFAYDGQLEDSRAPYLFDLISLSDRRERIRKAVLGGLSKEQKDTWSLTQLFDLAKLFALQGDKEAKDAIYKGFLNNLIYRSNWAGSYEIVDLDGFEGLKFVAEKYGKDLQNDPDDWQDDAIIKYFEDADPNVNVYQLLKEAAINNTFIKTYLNAVNENSNTWRNHKKESVVYDNIVDDVLASKKARLYGRKFTDAEVVLIAQPLLEERDEDKIEKLLTVFSKYKFPLDSEFILKLAQDKNQSRAGLAIDALRFLTSDGIREFALANIDKTRNPGGVIRILKSNYKPGDDRLLIDLVKKFRNETTIESLTVSYIDIYKSNPTAECRLPLEAIYNKSNCGIHRKDVIKILIDNNVLSDQIKQELRFDCNDEIRKLYHNLSTQ